VKEQIITGSPENSRCRPFTGLSRRQFTKSGMIAAAGMCTNWPLSITQRGDSGNRTKIPLKIGHRAASMKMVGNFGVFKMASQIQGLMGVELQITSGSPNLQDWDAVRHYKREANRWGILIPSLAGVWNKGVSIMRSPSAGVNLLQGIRIAEFLGSSVVLVAFFRDNAPDMNLESSYGPVVEVLQRAAQVAYESGVVLGLENSLSPADNLKLIDLVNHESVKVYYDLYNMAHYGHAEEAVPGIALLGKKRICQVHVKNGENLIEERGPVAWEAAFHELSKIEYDGWYVFESKHTNRNQVIEATTRNIQFMKTHCQMPLA